MGVQDFTPEVQVAIDRNQDEASTRELYTYCRERGFPSINFDLIYGLPKQTPEGFARNLASVIEMRPDRVALYSYAHVPWIRGHQKYIEVEALPPREMKFALFLQAMHAFVGAGYQQIGMDHFALPTDELSQALGQRRLRRNFMGYTVQRSPQMMGLGVSAIGQRGAYVQNQKKLSTYYQSIEEGRLPVERLRPQPDDQVPACHRRIDVQPTSISPRWKRFGSSAVICPQLGELEAARPLMVRRLTLGTSR